MLALKIVLYIVAFFGLWYGSGLIVDSIKMLAKRLNVPSFAFSFFVLGVLTSIPEMAMGLNAISEGKPEIFVGSLLGGVIVTFLFIIPVLAIITKTIHVKKHLSTKNLLVTLGIISVPALFALDQQITNVEGFILVALYVCLFYIIRTRKDMFKRVTRLMKREQKDPRHNTFWHLGAGVAVVIVTSRFIVDQTIFFSEKFNVSIFAVSLIVLAVGTNLPELSLALRSLTSKAEDVAIGDYLGSAAANTLLFGIFTLINNGDVLTKTNFLIPYGFIVFALGAFFVMTRGKSKLTRKGGFILLGFYALFLIYQISSL